VRDDDPRRQPERRHEFRGVKRRDPPGGSSAEVVHPAPAPDPVRPLVHNRGQHAEHRADRVGHRLVLGVQQAEDGGGGQQVDAVGRRVARLGRRRRGKVEDRIEDCAGARREGRRFVR
jgi:hypothetical protein